MIAREQENVFLFEFELILPPGEPLNFWNGVLMCLYGLAIWGKRNYLGFEISRCQMCYMWLSWGRRDYSGSDISGMSLSLLFS